MLDDLDRKLLGALHVIPRGSFDDLGSVLGVDSSTIGRRFNRLLEGRVARVVGQVDWAMYSTTLPVHLFITPGPGTPHDALGQLQALPLVQHLAHTSGAEPIFATVHAPSEAATADLLAAIHALPDVARVQSLPVLVAQAKGAGWDPQLLDAAEQGRAAVHVGAAPAPDATLPDLDDTERGIVELLREDGRASAASLSRTLGLPSSTAHRVTRRVLDNGWVRPRVEIDPALLGFSTPFVLRVEVTPGTVSRALSALSAEPHARFTTRVAGPHSILVTGLARDRAELARFLDESVGPVPGVASVTTDIMLVERRRYWMDRDPHGGLDTFAPPPLL